MEEAEEEELARRTGGSSAPRRKRLSPSQYSCTPDWFALAVNIQHKKVCVLHQLFSFFPSFNVCSLSVILDTPLPIRKYKKDRRNGEEEENEIKAKHGKGKQHMTNEVLRSILPSKMIVSTVRIQPVTSLAVCTYVLSDVPVIVEKLHV